METTDSSLLHSHRNVGCSLSFTGGMRFADSRVVAYVMFSVRVTIHQYSRHAQKQGSAQESTLLSKLSPFLRLRSQSTGERAWRFTSFLVYSVPRSMSNNHQITDKMASM